MLAADPALVQPVAPPPHTLRAPAPASGAVTAGGMPGWQITLIALGAALVAAIAAVRLDRTRAARRPASATTT